MSNLVRDFRKDMLENPEAYECTEGHDFLDERGKDMTNSQYGKYGKDHPAWKGGPLSGAENRRAYLTVKAREYRHAKYGPPSRGPYAN